MWKSTQHISILQQDAIISRLRYFNLIKLNYASVHDIGMDVLEYDVGCRSFFVDGVDRFILLKSSLVIIFPPVGVFLELEDLLVILLLGESFPPPDEDMVD